MKRERERRWREREVLETDRRMSKREGKKVLCRQKKYFDENNYEMNISCVCSPHFRLPLVDVSSTTHRYLSLLHVTL